MSDLNGPQQRIADAHEGMIVVDAGPGTGKTHTIVERYIKLISKPDVSPKDVLLLTFTNNAAAEMEERIKNRMTELGLEKDSKLVMTKTFDAFCLSIVLDSPDEASSFFGFKERLTRSATMQENDALNRDYFIRFLDGFLSRKGEDYGDIAIIANNSAISIMKLIGNLMSRGLIPLKHGWFGNNWDSILEGDTDSILDALHGSNEVSSRGKCENMNVIKKIDKELLFEPPSWEAAGNLPDDALIGAAKEDRSSLFRFVHDVYYDYIKQSVADNRLTFGLVSILAFAILYSSRSVRDRNSFRYLMVDEFQDTNANQLMISLMILSEPNLCVVGDWKQGIYGFRYVSIENITEFESKTVEYRRFLNSDGERRVTYSIPETLKLPLDLNYRSSQPIIDTAFRCLYLKGAKNENLDTEQVKKNVVEISAQRTDIGEDTSIRFVQSPSLEDEVNDTIRAIKDYVFSDGYSIKDVDRSRRPCFGDIAVICRKTEHCRRIHEACEAEGIPAYLQGDVQIMSTREGKLALAWLKYVNNERDPWAFVPIMADMDYTPIQIDEAVKHSSKIPKIISDQRDVLYRKRRRITDLLTCIFQFYSLDNDITQAIISSMSSVHRGSLLTISDVIRIIEEDISSNASYPIENFIDTKAVTIMTMHKSKGLEFPIVIAPFIDFRVVPSFLSDHDDFSYNQMLGLRCKKEIGHFGEYEKICVSWRTRLCESVVPNDYSEERRLMFVALSRAKQYETVICGPEPSAFIEGLNDRVFEEIPDCPYDPRLSAETLIPRPVTPEYARKRIKLGVHQILRFNTSEGISASDGSDEVGGKGMEYGTMIHGLAEMMCNGKTVKEDYPEIAEIRKVLDRISDSDINYAEIECGLPVEGTEVTLRGVIDLLALYEDHIEIHDYKTDVSDRFEEEYTMQLSIYAHAVSQFYHQKNVECFIDYVSRGLSKKVGIQSMDDIRARVEAYMTNINTDD
jgi:ATP-dependent exoDNAse (exonuclease V) beta subunit